jgi:hypothetical protein
MRDGDEFVVRMIGGVISVRNGVAPEGGDSPACS